MPNSIEQQQEATEFIDKFLTKAIDELVFKLESDYNFTFSPSTLLSLVLLTTDFKSRLATTINSEDLMEPESFDLNFYRH